MNKQQQDIKDFEKEEIKRLENETENMNQMDMTRRWRFAKSGDQIYLWLFSEELTPEEDWIAKWQYGYLGHFHKALFEAICAADEGNLNRLSLGFPDEVEGYRKYTRQAGWWKEVQKKIDRSVAEKHLLPK